MRSIENELNDFDDFFASVICSMNISKNRTLDIFVWND